MINKIIKFQIVIISQMNSIKVSNSIINLSKTLTKINRLWTKIVILIIKTRLIFKIRSSKNTSKNWMKTTKTEFFLFLKRMSQIFTWVIYSSMTLTRFWTVRRKSIPATNIRRLIFNIIKVTNSLCDYFN